MRVVACPWSCRWTGRSGDEVPQPVWTLVGRASRAPGEPAVRSSPPPARCPCSSAGCHPRWRADPDPAGVIGIRDEPCSDPPFPRSVRCGLLRDALNHVRQTHQRTSGVPGCRPSVLPRLPGRERHRDRRSPSVFPTAVRDVDVCDRAGWPAGTTSAGHLALRRSHGEHHTCGVSAMWASCEQSGRCPVSAPAHPVFSLKEYWNEVRPAWPARQHRHRRAAVRELHRRQMAGSDARQVPRRPEPGHRPADHRGRALHARGRRARAGRRARGEGRLGRGVRDRARRGAQRDRRRDRGEQGDARRRRELGERQAGPRDPERRHPAGRRPLPLLRRRGPRRGGQLDRDRQGPGRLPLPRAAGRGRSDHPVQLPAADGRLEARARAGRRQLLGPQARLADPVVDPEADGGHRGRRPARA